MSKKIHISPMDTSIAYMRGYKYQLTEGRAFCIPALDIYAGHESDYVEIHSGGILIIKKGYAWDGASGPTIDTDSSMRGSLVHDVLYQLMRNDIIDRSFRETADYIIEELCVLDGMWKWRASFWKIALTGFGSKNALASRRKRIYYAP